MTRLLVPLTTLGLFCALASYAYARYQVVYHPATVSQGEFIAQKLAEFKPREDHAVAYRPRTKMVFIWKDRKSAMIADTLSLTPESIDDTVDVRRLR